MQQFYVVLADGQKFGPVGSETLMQWAAEGRVVPENFIQDAASGQTYAASQFTQLWATSAPAPAPVPAPAPAPAAPVAQSHPGAVFGQQPAPANPFAQQPAAPFAAQAGPESVFGQHGNAALQAQPQGVPQANPWANPPQLQVVPGQVGAINPDALSKFSFGAMGLTWLWGCFHRAWLTFLIIPIAIVSGGLAFVHPFAGIFGVLLNWAGLFWIGKKGYTWAWKSGKFQSEEHLYAVQKKWNVWGMIFLAFNLMYSLVTVLGLLEVAMK